MALKTDSLCGDEARIFQAGRALANPPPGEEVCITGMAGRFPESDDVYQLRQNLLDKVNMVTYDDRRWERVYPEIPHHMGKLSHLRKFDAGLFGMHPRLVDAMDPQCRIVLEKVVEAVMDAGYNPQQIRGARAGVFIGVAFLETEKAMLYGKRKSPSYAILGCSRSIMAQRISYALGLKGPSLSMNNACCGSLYAVKQAYQAIRSGQCDMALVGTSSLCLHPFVALQFGRVGVISCTGSCKSFDNDADGYIRSEAVSVIVLQKAKDAKRIYAQIVHGKTISDGFKEQGISFPSSVMQKRLLTELYEECNIDPTTIDYVEAHATGTKVGDPQEVKALDEVFCTNRKKPLYTGSLKSNTGHTEIASGVSSIVKVLLSMENDYLLPNIHYKHPRDNIEALKTGRMKVVTDLMPWPTNGSGLVGINSFGFGGTTVHVLLKRATKGKINGGLPIDDLPRLVCVSGRTPEAVTCICDDISGRALDADYVRLLQDVFRQNIPQHSYRGYISMSKNGELDRGVEWFEGEAKPACLVFGAPDKEWMNNAKQLLNIPLILTSIQKINQLLRSKNVDIMDAINSDINKQDAIDVILGSTAIQLGVVDLLKEIDFVSAHAAGRSTGELVAAYARNAATLEQTVLAIYDVTLCLSQFIKSCTNTCPVKNYKNCFKGQFKTTDTISSGLDKNHNRKFIKSNDFNSIQIDADLHRFLKNIVLERDENLSNCNTNSTNKEQLAADESNDTPIEYFAGKLLTSILFHEAAPVIPKEAVLVNVGTNLCDPKQSPVVNLTSTSNNNQNGVHGLLTSLGRLYNYGHNLSLEKLYPHVEWPVSVGTPMISPVIKWNHTSDWYLADYTKNLKTNLNERIITPQLSESEWVYVIKGQNPIPATGCLVMAWEVYAARFGKSVSTTKVVFDNVKFHNATDIQKDFDKIHVVVNYETGSFEIAELHQPIVSGKINLPESVLDNVTKLPSPTNYSNSTKLTKQDIYKELKLRGHNYTKEFCTIKEYDLEATKGLIEWTGDWIVFLDAMLQISLLQRDTRDMHVLSEIERLSIDPKLHSQYVQETSNNSVVPVYVQEDSNITRTDAVEFRGIIYNSVSKHRLERPILQTYKFIPLEANLATEDAMYVATQLYLENSCHVMVRVVEVLKEGFLPLSQFVYQALSDEPLVQMEVTALSEKKHELPNISVVNRKLSAEIDSCSIVIVSGIFDRPKLQKDALDALQDNGIVISRENLNFAVENALLPGLDTFAVYKTENHAMVLMRRSVKCIENAVIDMSNGSINFDWRLRLQAAISRDEKIILVSQNDLNSGLLGFYKSLRREPGGFNVKCVLILDDRAPRFDTKSEFYANQLNKGLAVNIFKDGKWGTYRHVNLLEDQIVYREHVFNSLTVRGDLSSLKWFEGPLTSKAFLPPDQSLIHVYYATLNCRDVMVAIKHVNSGGITGRFGRPEVQGFEFVGRDKYGKRTMGLTAKGALSSLVIADNVLTFEIPDRWTMEEAATVLAAYGTVLYSFTTIGGLKDAQSILIHAGSGGIGQAAINVALHYKCNIFITVTTQTKREFIKGSFPQIPDSHIGSLRDTSFEKMVMKETNGRGVDIVLSFFTEGSFQASVRCLAPGGHFVELGTLQAIDSHTVGLKNLGRNCTFNCVTLFNLLSSTHRQKMNLRNLILKGLEEDYIKPLYRVTFQKAEVEQAFRHMATDKYIGKVLIKLRNEENGELVEPVFKLYPGAPRFNANSDKSYIIVGGLQGFGLELADWLVARGVKKLVLVSRTGIKNGYQAYRLRLWKSHRITINISTNDITTIEGCRAIVKHASILGSVEGIFNAAVGLKENQRDENFRISSGSQAVVTQLLDEVSREMCPELKYFVAVSSIACGRGGVGRTNYGLASSIMEKICERRKEDGLPSLVIQWGAIKEVGLSTETQELDEQLEVGGVLKQSVASCLHVMDKFLNQNELVVSSMLVQEKQGNKAAACNIVDAVKKIMGLPDLATVSPHFTLPELGMDSIMTNEIKQTLERDHEVFLEVQDIRSMTFARLQEMVNERTSHSGN